MKACKACKARKKGKARKKERPEGMQIRKARRHVGYRDT